jgi:hypothetical protein
MARLIWSSFENVHCLGNGDGLYCEPAGFVAQLAFRNCRFGNSTGNGVRVIRDASDALSGWHFDTCTFEQNALNGVYVSGAASGIAGFTFTSCYTEENALSIPTLSTAPYKANFFIDAAIALGVNINGCSLYSAATPPDWNIVVTSATQSGVMGANRVGAMTSGFCNVGSGWFIGPQAGGTGSITKAVGSDVTIRIPAISATSNTTAATLTGLPAELWPARDQSVVCRVQNGASGIVMGLFQIAAGTGVITLSADLGGGLFLNVGTKGIPLQTLTYSMI